MIGVSERGKLAKLTPVGRYLEKSRRHRAEQILLAKRRALIVQPEPEAPSLPAKGHCRHCGKHVGQGIAFHERACRPSQTS